MRDKSELDFLVVAISTSPLDLKESIDRRHNCGDGVVRSCSHNHVPTPKLGARHKDDCRASDNTLCLTYLATERIVEAKPSRKRQRPWGSSQTSTQPVVSTSRGSAMNHSSYRAVSHRRDYENETLKRAKIHFLRFVNEKGI